MSEIKNINQTLLQAMDDHAEQTCFQIKQGRHYQKISYQQLQSLAFYMAFFFIHHKIANGERVVIVADNSLEWMVAYLGCLFTGAVAVPVHTSVAPSTLHFILQDSNAAAVILQDQEHLQIVSANWKSDTDGSLSRLKTILTVNFEGESPLGVIAIEDVLAEPSLPPQEKDPIRTHAENIPPQTLASIFYVASETGNPKGAVFDHAQILTSTHQLAEWFTLDDDELAFTTRPWSELPNLLVTHHYLLSGVPNALAESEEMVGENMQQTSPTVMLSVPYGSEIFYEEYMARLAEQPEASQEVFRWALAKGKEYHAAGSEATAELRQEYARADMTFFSQIRGEMGGRMRRSYSTRRLIGI